MTVLLRELVTVRARDEQKPERVPPKMKSKEPELLRRRLDNFSLLRPAHVALRECLVCLIDYACAGVDSYHTLEPG